MAGDLAIVALMLPIFALVLSGLLMIPVLVLALGFGVGHEGWLKPGWVATLVVALVLSVDMLRKRLIWRVAVDGDRVVFGGGAVGWSAPLSTVTLVRLGERLKGRHATSDGGTVPLTVQTAHNRTARIFLGKNDALRCFGALMEACDGAAGVDLDGKEHLPKNPDKIPAARRRLGRLLLSSGALELAVGAALLLLLGMVGVDLLRGERELEWELFEGIEVLVTGVTLVGAGWYSLRRARRYFRPLDR